MSIPTQTLIDLQAVSFQAGEKKILEGISFSIQPRTITTLLGPNGAGKTTLLKILLGFLKPSSGHITQKQFIRVGYMPQKFPINPALPLTVHRFLRLTRRPCCPPEEALAEVGASHLLHHSLKALSGGEFQRVVLAKSLMRHPHLLILDEPTQALDVGGQHHFYDLIGQLRDQKGCAVLLVSHDLYMVMATSDQVICLNRHICCAGTPQVIQNHKGYLSLFPKLEEKNLAFYTHHHDHQHPC